MYYPIDNILNLKFQDFKTGKLLIKKILKNYCKAKFEFLD